MALPHERRLLKNVSREKLIDKRTIGEPGPNTDHYLPSNRGFDFTFWGFGAWLVYSPDGDALAVQVELSEDNETFYDLEGVNIDVADYAVGRWNFIHSDINAPYLRLRVTTGATEPSEIRVMLTRRPF